MTTIAPETAAETAGVLRDAAADGLTVLAAGAGTKAHWGGQLSKVDIVLDLRRLSGVTMHEPGDLVATVRSGTPLREAQVDLGLAGQRLAVETGSPGATIGGILATGEAGPSRLRFGAGRDLLIGVEFVRADGVVARAGGRVVKNVAGYDLGRLLCGSYGTLGVITSATFRLHPLPAARAWVTRTVREAAELPGLVLAATAPAVSPTAVEVDLGAAGGQLAVAIEGSAAGVARRAEDAVRLLGDGAAVGEAPGWWGRYPFGVDDVALRVATRVAALGAALDAVLGGLSGEVRARGSAGAGVVHVGLPAAVGVDRLAAALEAVRAHGSCVVLAAPPSIRDAVDLWGPVPGLDLMRRVKDRLDPAGVFASGRFVGGI